tara:strand:- start:227 stop:844 length:618 start_codon:yes stop_codon:yes gene_type:complete
MINLNEVQPETSQMERTLIPLGTVARAIILVKMGDVTIPEFGNGQWFKKSQSSSAKWMELEFTIVGGQFDRRKFWDRIFVDGDKLGESGIPLAKEIGLRTLRSIIESANSLDPSDMSPEAQSRRQISGVDALNGMEICAKVGVKKGTNGYEDANKLMVALTPNQKEFISSGNNATQQVQQPSYQPQAPAPTQPASSGPIPSWANK